MDVWKLPSVSYRISSPFGAAILRGKVKVYSRARISLTITGPEASFNFRLLPPLVYSTSLFFFFLSEAGRDRPSVGASACESMDAREYESAREYTRTSLHASLRGIARE